jgi:regulator of PEP synthase PpsR (kinase-PPPase family)|tara:strand:+ start:37 stop:864 length:828 start_codon:yes stop_codon:yes gene_type:complete
MKNLYQIYLISDSTGETLDRIFLALKAQFPNFEYETNHFSFTRTESQTLSILKQAKKEKNSIILYTIVNSKLAKYLTEKAYEREIPCFGVLGDLILNFSKVLNQKASHQPSGQHILNEEYYDRIEAIQFTMNHDDGNQTDDIEKSDIILLGVSRTSKTPTSIYLANRGFKTSNIPLVNKDSIPSKVIKKNFSPCVVGLFTEAERLYDLRKNRLNSLKEDHNSEYVNIDKIRDEVNNSRKIFKENNWPTIDVTRKSVEETAASIIKIYEIKNKKND